MRLDFFSRLVSRGNSLPAAPEAKGADVKREHSAGDATVSGRGLRSAAMMDPLPRGAGAYVVPRRGFFEKAPEYQQRLLDGLRNHLLRKTQASLGADATLPARVDRTLQFMGGQIGKPEFLPLLRDTMSMLERVTEQQAQGSRVDKRSPHTVARPLAEPTVTEAVSVYPDAPEGSARGLARRYVIETFRDPASLVGYLHTLPPSQSLGRSGATLSRAALVLINTFASEAKEGDFSEATYRARIETRGAYASELRALEDRLTALIEEKALPVDHGREAFLADIRKRALVDRGEPANPAVRGRTHYVTPLAQLSLDESTLRGLVADALVATTTSPPEGGSGAPAAAMSSRDIQKGAARLNEALDAFLESPIGRERSPGQVSPFAETGYVEESVLESYQFSAMFQPHDFLSELRPNAHLANLSNPRILQRFQRLMREEIAFQATQQRSIPEANSAAMRTLLMNARSAVLSRMQFEVGTRVEPLAPGEICKEEVNLRMQMLDQCHADIEALQGRSGYASRILPLKVLLHEAREALHGFDFPNWVSLLKLHTAQLQSDVLRYGQSPDPYYSPAAFRSCFESLSKIEQQNGRPPLRTEADVRKVRLFVHAADAFLAERMQAIDGTQVSTGTLDDQASLQAKAARQSLAEAYLPHVVDACTRRGLSVQDFNALTPAEKRVLLFEASANWGGLFAGRSVAGAAG